MPDVVAVTEEMVAAGVAALHQFDSEDFHRQRERLVEALFRAMADVMPTGKAAKEAAKAAAAPAADAPASP